MQDEINGLVEVYEAAMFLSRLSLKMDSCIDRNGQHLEQGKLCN